MKPSTEPLPKRARSVFVASYDPPDRAAQSGLDALTELAAMSLGTSSALILLDDGEHHWFVSRYGLNGAPAVRDVAFCRHVVEHRTALIVPDALRDERFAAGSPPDQRSGARFYAGVPLIAANDLVFGVLCVIDAKPRTLATGSLHPLQLLACQATEQLSLRRSARLQQLHLAALQSHQRFFELSLELLCTADESLIVRDLNPSWERILGWSLEEMRGRSMLEFVHPDDVAAAVNEAQRLLQQGGITLNFETRCRHKLGHWVPLSWSVALADGTFYAAAHDMTLYREQELALRQSRQQLHESDSRLRALFDGMAEGVVVQDDTGRIIASNTSAERILGLTTDQLLGRRSVDPKWHCTRRDGSPFPGAEHPAMVSLRTGVPQSNVIMGVHRPAGSIAWISINSQPLKLQPSAAPYAVATTFRDITAEIDAERELRGTTARLHAIIDTAVDAILTIDVRGRIESVNAATLRLFGYASQELVASNVRLLLSPPDRSRLERYLDGRAQTVETPSMRRGREVSVVSKDGATFFADLALSEFLVGGERRYTLMLRDLSERKEVERIQSEFVSTVSHELRTPLTAIRGSLGLSAAGATGALSLEGRDCVELALKNCDRLTRLIDDLLDLERMQSGRMLFRPVILDLARALRDAVAIHRTFASSQHVELDLDSELAEGCVYADEDRLLQVFGNLISNAVKFSPAGASIELSLVGRADMLRVRVRDHGPGLSEEFRRRVFQRFAQGDASNTRSKGGAGLGLHISKAIVEQMGGSIGFEAATAGGTIFYFDLPRHETTLHADPRRAP